MLSIDEAIAREREIAEMHRNDIVPKEDYHNMPWIDKENELNMRSAEEHEQTAEWLEELKANKATSADVYEQGYKLGYKNGYNKAIDDFAEKAIKIVYESNNRDRNPQPRDMVADIHYKFIELAEQLKEGGENDNLRK